MAMTDYRRQRSADSNEPWMNALRREVAAEVADEMKALKKQIADLTAQISGRKTDVHVTSPAVSVAAPSVSVAAPTVTAPVQVDVDLSELRSEVVALREAIVENSRILRQPVTRTVQRGTDNLIKSMTEKRG